MPDKECPDCCGTGSIKDAWAMDESGNLIDKNVRCKTCEGTGFVLIEDPVERWKEAV